MPTGCRPVRPAERLGRLAASTWRVAADSVKSLRYDVSPPPATSAAMPRLPYVPADLAEPREAIDAIRKRRGGALLNLDRQLLHSPPQKMGHA